MNAFVKPHVFSTQACVCVKIPHCVQEFLPAAKPVGYNELEVSTTLSGLPDMKWQAAVSVLSSDPPVVPILGCPPPLHTSTFDLHLNPVLPSSTLTNSFKRIQSY